MTTQSGAGPTDGVPASQTTKPLRELGALVLLGANAVFLFVAFLNMVYSDSEYAAPFSIRAAGSFDGFVSLTTIALPFVAVLLATHVQPPVARAKAITLIALVEYAVSAFFGVFFGVLIGLIGLAEQSVWLAFLSILSRLAWLALLGAAGYAVLRIWRVHYYVPKPKPQPGVYGQPQPYGQPGYPQQYGQPYGQPQYGAPYPSAPQSAPSAPQSAPPSPQSAPPAPQHSPFAPPAAQQSQPAPQQSPSAPQSAPPGYTGAEPTQAIRLPGAPAEPADADAEDTGRTQVLRPLDQPPATPGQEGPDDGQRTQVIKPTDPS